MAIGTALLLVAVGAILAYAVDFDIPGIDVQTVGNVLFFVGMLGLAITIGMELLAQRARRPVAPVAPRGRERVREREVADAYPVARRVSPPPPPAAPYDPIVGPPAGGGGGAPRPRPAAPRVDDDTWPKRVAPDDGTRPTRVARRDDAT